MCTLFEKATPHPKMVSKMKGKRFRHSNYFTTFANKNTELWIPCNFIPLMLYLARSLNLSRTLVRSQLIFEVHLANLSDMYPKQNAMRALSCDHEFLQLKQSDHCWNNGHLQLKRDKRKQEQCFAYMVNLGILPGMVSLSQQSLVNISTTAHK